MSDKPQHIKMKTLKEALEMCTEYDELNKNCYFDAGLEKFCAQKSSDYRDVQQAIHMLDITEEPIKRFQKSRLMKAMREGHLFCFAKEAPKNSKTKVTKIDPSQWQYLDLNVESNKAEGLGQEFIELTFQVEARLYGLNSNINTGSVSKAPIILEAYTQNAHEISEDIISQDKIAVWVQSKLQEKGHDITQRGFGIDSIKKTLRKHGKFK